jgi:hypothetical protein
MGMRQGDAEFPPHAPQVYQVLDWEIELAHALNLAGRQPEAEPEFRTLLSKNRQVFGASSYPTAETEAVFADVLQQGGKYVEAEALARESVALMGNITTLDDYYARRPSEILALVLSAEGHYREAQEINRHLLHAVEGHATRDQGEVWYVFAESAALAGRRSESIQYLDKAVRYGSAPAGEIAADTDLKSLHGDPRFEALIVKARQTEAR